jgi:hypothetical protein
MPMSRLTKQYTVKKPVMMRYHLGKTSGFDLAFMKQNPLMSAQTILTKMIANVSI